MPEEPLDPKRLAAERAWIAAYPALITSGVVTAALIAVNSSLYVGAKSWLGLRLVVSVLVLICSAGYAQGDRGAGRVVIAWAAVALVLDLVVARDLPMAVLGAVILLVLYRVRPVGAGARAAPRSRPLRWVIPAALVGVIDVVLPLMLGSVTPTRIEDVARVTSATAADLDTTATWAGGGARLLPRGELLVLDGIELVRGQEVAIDPGRRALLIGDAVFRGEPLAEPNVGLSFRRRFGRVRGRVVAQRVGPDALQLSFDDLEVDCRRVSARFVLRRQQVAPALPVAPERE